MGKKITIREDKTGKCISVDCDKLMSFGNDPEYIAVIGKKMYRKNADNIYEFLYDTESEQI